jgi:hypothetical protein
MNCLSWILAEKIVSMLQDSGASEIEQLAAIDAARAIVPVMQGSMAAKHADAEKPESF